MPVIILDKLFQLVVCFPLSISIYFPPNNQLSKDLHRFYLNKPCTVHSSANITNASKTQLYFFLFQFQFLFICYIFVCVHILIFIMFFLQTGMKKQKPWLLKMSLIMSFLASVSACKFFISNIQSQKTTKNSTSLISVLQTMISSLTQSQCSLLTFRS